MNPINSILKKFYFTFVLAASLAAAPTVLAGTTVLTFDDVADGPLTSQYQSLGVLFSGAEVVSASVTPWPSHSGTKLAYSPLGNMTLSFNNTITGNVEAVSAYISGQPNTGIFAYDSNGNLVGQSMFASPSINTLLTVTSSSAPIARVDIHDGGATFGVDTLTFVAADPVPICVANTRSLYSQFMALPLTAYKDAKRASTIRSIIGNKIICFENALLSDTSNKILLLQLASIKASIDTALKSSAEKTAIMNLINQLISLTKAGQC